MFQLNNYKERSFVLQHLLGVIEKILCRCWTFSVSRNHFTFSLLKLWCQITV